MTIDASALEKMRAAVRGRCRKKPATLSAKDLGSALMASMALLQDDDRDALLRTGPDGEAAIAFLMRSPTAPLPNDLELRSQALLARKVGFGARRASDFFVPLWLVCKGLAFATEALALSAESSHPRHDQDFDEEWRLQSTFFRWELLREQLAIASEADWRAAHARAAASFERTTPIVRCALAFAFPEEPTWAERGAAEWLELVASPAPHGKVRSAPFAGYATLASLADPVLLAKLCAHARATTGYGQMGAFAADAACLHQEAALPPLLEVFSVTESPGNEWTWARPSIVEVARTLACFDDPRAVDVLANKLDHKVFGPIAVEQLDRFPESAIAVLAPSIGDKSKKAERRLSQLDGLLRVRPELVENVAPSLPAEVGRALRQRVKTLVPLVDAAGDTGPSRSSNEAPREAWPAVLAHPPWRSKEPRAVRPTVAGLVVPPRPARLVLDEESRARFSVQRDRFYPELQESGAQEAMLAKARANESRTTKLGIADWSIAAYLLPTMFSDERLAAMWSLPPFSSTFDLHAAEQALVRLGEAAIPGAVARMAVDSSLFPLVLYLDTNELSVLLARAFRKPSQRALAQRALARFPDTHAPALAALALSGEGRDADLSAQALRWLATQDAKAVLDGAEALGAEARAALEALLAVDPLQNCPVRPPRLSDFAEPESLPRPRLRDQRPLPVEALRNFLEMLQFSPVDPRYPGIDAVAEACDPPSLDDLGWALVQAWDRSGGASASAWALHALGHIGSDAVVKKLASEIRRWPREKAKSRALLGLGVLARMGTDIALLHLDELSKKARNKDVEARAAALLAEVAEARDLSPVELEDRLVPTLELSAEGGRTIAIGERILRVCFDPYLEPYLVDANGVRFDKILKQKGDEPEALKRAQEAWKELRGDASAITKALMGRAERAMCEERRWDVVTFRSLFAKHPLTQHLARNLVWGTFQDAKLEATFRIAEDGTFADPNDGPFVLEDSARVGIVHPLSLQEAVLKSWQQRFLDYEILQPFEQLGRLVVNAEGDGNARLAKATNKEVTLGALVGVLESRGFRMTSPDGDGILCELHRSFGNVKAYVTFSPGFRPREPRPDKVTIHSVGFYEAPLAANAPPIAYAELVRDLTTLGLV